MRTNTVILYRDHSKQRRHRWTEKAGNGEPVARSAQGKGYARAANRNKGLRAAAKGFGVWLDDVVFPGPGESIGLHGAGSRIRDGRLFLVMTDAGEEYVPSLIIRNED